MTELIKKVEAVLFAIGRTISEKEIAQLTNSQLHEAQHALRELKKQYTDRDAPLLIIQEGDGWKLTVHEKYLPVVQQITPHTELSRAILETLAVIAWKHPAKQSDVIKIRTNKAYEHIDELERLGFVNKEKHGRSFLIKVTQKFFDYFDLPKDKGVKEVFKDIKDVEAAVQTKFSEQGENLGLETYGVKEEIQFKKEKKEHIGDLEVFEDVEEHKEESEEESPKEAEEAPREEKQPEKSEESEEEPQEESEEEKPTEEERELEPELEEMIEKEKK